MCVVSSRKNKNEQHAQTHRHCLHLAARCKLTCMGTLLGWRPCTKECKVQGEDQSIQGGVST